ncbi:glutamate decarboxylase [Macrolepiota fuliginosa MF-IS2]|uniref:Glutamate decarboxylase n=1 Tax=Macrolepiota fuliginosa MF-IS2 TaxID=1400762 RepID=A0A9P5XBK9_9AGAR|nr:glutamate decarboxylase [Macrolepiota fuliginosa MF-IS2]
MSLSKANPDVFVEDPFDETTAVDEPPSASGSVCSYGERSINSVSRFHIPLTSTDAETTYRVVRDELTLDGSGVMNVASSVQTWMPPMADKLLKENIFKNLTDADEYPASQMLHTRCISMIANLWHAPSAAEAVGTATTGSTEAVLLAGLAMKKDWQEKMKAAGKNIFDPGPNIVMSANSHVALEKFARYFDVECRLVPVSRESRYHLDINKAMLRIDENTIGVYMSLGSTYTGHYENVKGMAALLDAYQSKTCQFVPIHVDAASGGFVAPFVHPHLLWDFRISRVVSINTSGHKFGLSYVGVGWVIWRNKSKLPKSLVFELHSIGSVEYTFCLTSSRPAAPIIAQYFNLIHLGYQGYRRVALDDLKNARLLSRVLELSGYFEVLSDIHREAGLQSEETINSPDFEVYEPGLPVVVFRFSDKFRQEYPHVQQYWVQTLLAQRARGWLLPNYCLPPDCQDTEVLRVVVRENLTEIHIRHLIDDIFDVMKGLTSEKSEEFLHGLVAVNASHARVDSQEKPGDSELSGTYVRPC